MNAPIRIDNVFLKIVHFLELFPMHLVIVGLQLNNNDYRSNQENHYKNYHNDLYLLIFCLPIQRNMHGWAHLMFSTIVRLLLVLHDHLEKLFCIDILCASEILTFWPSLPLRNFCIVICEGVMDIFWNDTLLTLINCYHKYKCSALGMLKLVLLL